MAASCLIGIWALFGLANWMLVEGAARSLQASAQNTAAMSATYVKQALDGGSLVLHAMQALLAEKGVQGEASYRAYLEGPAATQALRDRIANMKEIDKAAFIAPTGEILNFSVVYPPPPINVADRDYFREQMAEGAPERSLSASVLDRSSGKWTFFLAQRVKGGVSRASLLARGSGSDSPAFGLAIVGIRASLLGDFFGQNRLADGMVLLLRDDDVLLSGSGVPPTAYGRKLSLDSAALRELNGGRAASDGVVASDPVAGYPARIVVLAGPLDPLGIVRESLPFTAAVGLLASAAVLFALWRTLGAIGGASA